MEIAMKKNGSRVWVGVAALVLAAGAFAADGPTTAASGPTTPKAAALEVLAAAKTGDLEATLAYFLRDTDKQKNAAEGLVLEILPQAAVDGALKARYGKEAHVDSENGDLFAKEISRVEWGQAVIEGDKAKYYLGSDGKPPVGLTGKADIVLRRVEGVWKIDASALVSDGKKKELGNPRRRYKLAQEIAADIQAGKFRTAEEALASMRERMAALEKVFDEEAARDWK
jgi:hypothetical protein